MFSVIVCLAVLGLVLDNLSSDACCGFGAIRKFCCFCDFGLDFLVWILSVLGLFLVLSATLGLASGFSCILFSAVLWV